MSDYDRGAYTPQTDAPLAFDPRRPSERRPMPMALIGSAVVLVVLLAGVAMVYRGGVRHAGESPRPVGEPVMAVKTAPPPGQTASTSPAPAASMDVYNSGEGNTTSPAVNQTAAAAPTFTAPAEQPAARPKPSAATVAMLSKPPAPTHIERPPTPTESVAQPTEPSSTKLAAAPPKKAPAAPAKASTAKTVAANDDEAPAPAKPAPVKKPVHHTTLAKIDESELAAAGGTRTVAAETDSDVVADTPPLHKAKLATVAANTPAATASSAKAVVQIGAFSSSALADKGYADVTATLPSQMSGKAKHVQPLDKDGTTLYRTWLSGFATRADAQSFCDALKAKGKTCLVRG